MRRKPKTLENTKKGAEEVARRWRIRSSQLVILIKRSANLVRSGEVTKQPPKGRLNLMREHEKQTPSDIQIPLLSLPFFLAVFCFELFLILHSSFSHA